MSDWLFSGTCFGIGYVNPLALGINVVKANAQNFHFPQVGPQADVNEWVNLRIKI
jgi:hypothetical protein